MEIFSPTWRYMGTYNPNYKSTEELLGGLRGLLGRISSDIVGAVSSLNLPVVLGTGCNKDSYICSLYSYRLT